MRHGIVIAAAVAGILATSASAAASKKGQPTHPAARAALLYFESIQGTGVEVFIRQLRRTLPSRAHSARVITSLPQEGNLIPTAREAAKLASIRPVMAFHGREGDIDLRVIAAGGQAFIGLHARAVLLITREALGLIDTHELQALVAHELGHEYVWDEYEEARTLRDSRRLQELELRCDGIAVITLQGLAVDAERLVSAVTMVTRHNERVGAIGTAAWYVPLRERVRFIRAVTRLTASRLPANR
jgi:hypothetical protein